MAFRVRSSGRGSISRVRRGSVGREGGDVGNIGWDSIGDKVGGVGRVLEKGLFRGME